MKKIILILSVMLGLAACGSDADYGISNEPISANVPNMGGIAIDAIADFAPNSDALVNANYYSTATGIVINGWTGLSARAIITNPGYRALTVDAGRIYCATNCHHQEVACSAIYNSCGQKIINRHIEVNPKSYMEVYLTFANVFDCDDIAPESIIDAEITVWATDPTGAPVLGIHSFGGDESIIYIK